MIKFFKDSPNNSKIVKQIDFLFIFRPVAFIVVWLLICIGMYIPHYSNETISLLITNFSLNTFLFFLSLTLLSSIFIINNQIRKTDKNYILNKKFDLVYLIKLKKILFVFSFLIVLYVCWPLSFFFIVCYFVSTKIEPKINSSNIKFLIYQLGMLSILLFSGVYYQLFYYDIPFNFKIIVISATYFLIFSGVYLINESYGSSNNHLITVVSYFSKRTIAFITFLINLLSFVLLLLFNDPLGSTVLSVILFFNLYGLFRGSKKDFMRIVRYSIGIFIFFTLSIYPLLFIPTVIVFYISKYYYWHRFDVHYPTFLVNNNTCCPIDLVVKHNR